MGSSLGLHTGLLEERKIQEVLFSYYTPIDPFPAWDDVVDGKNLHQLHMQVVEIYQDDLNYPKHLQDGSHQILF